MNRLKTFLDSTVMQGVAVVASAMMLFAGCSLIKPNVQSPRLLPEVNFITVSQDCTVPEDVFNIPPSRLNPAPYRLAKFDSCLGRTNVYIVLWPGEGNDINVQFARLLGLHFKESYSFENRVAVTHQEWGPFSSPDGNTWMLVFQLSE